MSLPEQPGHSFMTSGLGATGAWLDLFVGTGHTDVDRGSTSLNRISRIWNHFYRRAMKFVSERLVLEMFFYQPPSGIGTFLGELPEFDCFS